MVPDFAPGPGSGNFASAEAMTAIQSDPRFAQAMRATALGLSSMYHGRHLLNWLMDDRGRMLLGYLAIYLHATRDPRDPSSGLTPTRIKALCTEFDVCSPGRAGAMLSLMRFSGYLMPDIEIADRRQRRLVATDKLYALLRSRLKLHYTAMAPLFGDGAAMLAALDDKIVDGALVEAMVKRYRDGFRLVGAAPELGLFGERNGGMLILASLIAAGSDDDTVPPSRLVPISIAALAGVGASEAGLASGLINTSQQIGGALGIAALSTIATSSTEDSVGRGSAVPVALVDGFHSAFVVGAVVAALGIIAALTLIRRDELAVSMVEELEVEPALDAA